MYLIFWILILIKGLKMWNDFARYIMNEVGDEPVTIAEIAVGKFDKIAEELSKKGSMEK